MWALESTRVRVVVALLVGIFCVEPEVLHVIFRLGLISGLGANQRHIGPRWAGVGNMGGGDSQ